jgi:hypothetical protein
VTFGGTVLPVTGFTFGVSDDGGLTGTVFVTGGAVLDPLDGADGFVDPDDLELLLVLEELEQHFDPPEEVFDPLLDPPLLAPELNPPLAWETATEQKFRQKAAMQMAMRLRVVMFSLRASS